MNKVWVVWRKEMTDALRDPRTLFFMVVFPLVLYPLLLGGTSKMAAGQEKEIESSALTVVVQGGASAPMLLEELRKIPHVTVVESSDAAGEVRARHAQAGVRIPADAAQTLTAGGRVTADLYSEDSREISRFARGKVEEALQKYAQRATAGILQAHGLSAQMADPIDVKKSDVSPPEKKGGNMLAMFLPYFLALAVANGSVGTAIDTTAGEKDRSTLETVLVTSASRTSILVGKMLTVVTTALVATFSSAAGLAIAMLMGGLMMGRADGAHTGMHVSPLALLGVTLLAIPVAVLLSALLMSLGCYAKSAREGQTMAIALQMAVIFFGLSSMFQQTEPAIKSFAIPVLGTALVQKEILRGELNPTHLAIAVISSVVLAAIAIAISARLFGNERLMFRAK